MAEVRAKVWDCNPEARLRVRAQVEQLGWTYVQRYSERHSPTDHLDLLASLSGSDLAQLKAFRFLGSDAVARLIDALPGIMRSLPRSVPRADRLAREAKPPVSWTRTAVTQARWGDPGLFVVRASGSAWDLPENRILVYLLERIRSQAAISARSIRAEFRPVFEHLRSPALMGLSRTAPSGLDRQRLRRSRYRSMAGLLEAALRVHDGIEDDEAFLRSVLSESIWLPTTDAALFELWCLFELVRTLVVLGWAVGSLSLLGSTGDGPAFRLCRDGVVLELRFQTAPGSLVAGATYSRVLDAYGLRGGARRPDLVVTRLGEPPIHLIVEAKLSDDREYLTDSVYKVLGYLGDFAKGLERSPRPAAVLVVWSGIVEGVRGGDPVIAMLSAARVRSGGLAKLVERFAATGAVPPFPMAP